MNSTNKEIDYKNFIPQKLNNVYTDVIDDDVNEVKREIKIIDKNKNTVNMSVMLLLIIILLLNF